jgi:nitroreductase
VECNIEELLHQPHKGFFGNAVRFGLVEKQAAHANEKVRLGTYGFIKGARHFIAGAVLRQSMAEADYGYLFEQIILQLTRMGLGTCWIGGTFKRKDYVGVLNLSSDEMIPAISPVGYGTRRRAIADRVVRWAAKGDMRKPKEELFFDHDFSTALTSEKMGEYKDVLEMVRIAPSASNRQPWRWVAAGNTYHLHLERSKGYRKHGASPDLQMIDMGIAMAHFELAAKELDLPGEWEVWDPGIPSSIERNYIVSWIAKP